MISRVAFPRLAPPNHRVTSPPSRTYNCIAWAAGDDSKWWWPGPNLEEEFWPNSAPREETLDAFQAAFESLGYALCENGDLEGGAETPATALRLDHTMVKINQVL